MYVATTQTARMKDIIKLKFADSLLNKTSFNLFFSN